MRIFTAISLLLMAMIFHACGSGGNADPSATEPTPAPAPAPDAMEVSEPDPEPAVLKHVVDPATLALMIDPVCKMSFEEYAVTTTAEHGGKFYGFCSDFCKKNFIKDPDKLLARLKDSTPAAEAAP